MESESRKEPRAGEPGRLERVQSVTGIAYSVAAVLALLVGGAWALWEFKIQRVGAWSLHITLSPRLVATDKGQLLVTDVLLENIGKTVVRAHPAKRCVVSYWRLDVPQEAWKPLPVPCPPKRSPLAEQDLFEPYYECPRDDPRAQGSKEKYELEPGAKYHELSIITPEPGATILIKLQFYEQRDPDPMTEYAFFHVPKDRQPPGVVREAPTP